MVKQDKTNRKIVLEREYVVPLRKEWLKVPRYKRAKKALRALKEFMVQHMQIYDRDIRKIKVDVYLNNEIKFRGNKKPLHKIKVKAIKYDNGIVEVKLVNLPKHIEFEVARNAKKAVELAKNVEKSDKKAETEIKPEAKSEEATAEAKIEEKGREQESKVAEEQMDKAKAKEMKHSTGSNKGPEIKRKVMNK